MGDQAAAFFPMESKDMMLRYQGDERPGFEIYFTAATKCMLYCIHQYLSMINDSDI